jgi:hypothetical protein
MLCSMPIVHSNNRNDCPGVYCSRFGACRFSAIFIIVGAIVRVSKSYQQGNIFPGPSLSLGRNFLIATCLGQPLGFALGISQFSNTQQSTPIFLINHDSSNPSIPPTRSTMSVQKPLGARLRFDPVPGRGINKCKCTRFTSVNVRPLTVVQS